MLNRVVGGQYHDTYSGARGNAVINRKGQILEINEFFFGMRLRLHYITPICLGFIPSSGISVCAPAMRSANRRAEPQDIVHPI